MTTEVGTRVGAVLSADANEVKFFGYGTYQGDQIPESEDVLIMGFSAKKAGLSTPALLLDNGDMVYGCECWWGPEEAVKETFGERTLTMVRIGDLRKPAVNLEGVLEENGEQTPSGRVTSSNPPTIGQNTFFPDTETPTETSANNPPQDEQPATLPDTNPTNETPAQTEETAQGNFENNAPGFGGGGAGSDWEDNPETVVAEVEESVVESNEYQPSYSDEPSAANSDE